ncbi:hypothetical protein EHQ12_02065 [Leptospira gomenensis]|uniref:TRL-like family protein n=1 Tax=Leptospira gomenensis TaxID=2484974 RepID=A0A5F1YGP0_9LEPT|nr:TRL domain-containing protein [Leptospira gomenensis]TGK31512.1 hypothetical protein EHQ17_13960 [Leptospira gomenensis]TGK44162.1 hypothetical protein EHQ12_02065 [Leptospira gomenensis]TGK46217.1 hypothetical protein EHQ07_07195 [Leptospira gomenensis]TGK54742.1 hypothetical protein EHQ13_18785 [Leptospira gomenensis]
MRRILPKILFPVWIVASTIATSIGCIATSEPAWLISYNTQHLLSKSNGHLLSSANVARKGEGCAYAVSFFYYNTIFRGPKTSVADIAKEYGIKKIAVVDYSTFSFLGPVFYKNCIVVWGE